ncbi:hypothetical protein [Streptomyces sp. WAC 01325]|uniref:hypothetical protein n=1 Tax=Streptomyces sp. WAC 01325 TaxID=2203202 RepID=UPI000F8756DE|nr:hypothetical protein [Streptomyces sp. WAC 01325]
MDWISPVSGLVGALVGAGLSYLGTHRAQAKALADARLARLQAKQDQAVTALAETFGNLQKHVREVPGDWEPGMDVEATAALTAARAAWDGQLQDFIAPARLAIGVIRDKKLRHRLNETMNLLEEWDRGLVYAFYRRSRVGVLHGVITHAVDCVGAWQREDAMPEPNHAFRKARESMQAKRDEWEAIDEAREEERRQRRAERDSAATQLPPGGA